MRRLSLIYAVLFLALALALAGCGGSGDGSEGEDVTADAGNAGLVGWPFFGRVPERTHYLPAESGLLDPPLKEAWQVNTHALIEFPPAIADGVAYVINKYGNGKAIGSRPQDPLGIDRPGGQGQANSSPRRPITAGGSTAPSSTATWRRGREDGQDAWARDLRRPPRILAAARRRQPSTSAPTPPTSSPSSRRRPPRLALQLPAAIKASPSFTTAVSRRRLRELDVRARRRHRQGGLAHQHQQGGAGRRGRLLLLARDRLRRRLRRPR